MSRVKLLVGTRKGLFRATSSDAREHWKLEGPFIEGYEVYHAILDPRDHSRGYAAANHIVWGSHIHRSEMGARSGTTDLSLRERTRREGDLARRSGRLRVTGRRVRGRRARRFVRES